MARYLARWRLLGDRDKSDARRCLNQHPASVELTRADQEARPALDAPVRLPAQWGPVEAVIVTWPVLYPPLWPLYAQMVEAITPVARSEEHTSELQSRENLVCRLLLEKKKTE